MSSEKQETNYWKSLGAYLLRKWRAPRNHPTFYFYLVVAVMFAGSLGIIDAMIHGDLKSILSSLYTYFPAVAAASAFELILPQDHEKYIKSFAIAVAALLLGLALLMITLPTGKLSLSCGVIGYVIALALWWIVNAENPTLQDTPQVNQATVGGDTNRPLTGDLSQFKQ